MALSKPSKIFLQVDEYFNFNKVVKCLMSLGSPTLLFAFEWISEKDPAQSFKDFFLVEKQMPNSLYRNKFNKGQRDKMESDPIGKSFDVTLLFSVIRLGCGKLSQNWKDWEEGNDKSFESTLTMFKNLRNTVLHGDEKPFADDAKMIACLDKIQQYLEQILRLGAQFSAKGMAEVDDKVKKMKESVQEIKDSKLSPCDIAQYTTKIKELRDAQKQIVEKEGVSELKQEYKILSNITPVSLFSGSSSLDVRNIYTDTETVREVAGQTHISPVDSKEILVLSSDCGKKPKLIILEGDAGSGKSTMAKFIVTDWAANAQQGSSPTIKGTKHYALILYSEFRNMNICSLLSLLKVLIPQTSNEMDDKDLIKSICGLNTLVILDGWDEVNEASNKLMRDLLDNFLPRSKGKMELLLTTRPSKLTDLPSISQNVPKLHIRLTGVKHGKQLEFVTKVHEEMRKKGQSSEQTDPLVDYVKRSSAQMGEHFSLPLNLALLTYLWANDPSKVNSSTTATELYIALQEMMKLRLIERLQKRGLQYTKKELDDKCEDFLKTLYRVCFKTHASGSVELAQKHCKVLDDKCKQLQLPTDDMCSTFLNVKKEWTPSGYKLSLAAPHKSILEFFAAFCILFALYETQDEKAWQDVLEKSQLLPLAQREQIRKIYHESSQGQKVSIQSMFEAEFGANLSDQTFYHFENVLFHLGGILKLKDLQGLAKYGEELVRFMDKITSGDEERKVRTALKIMTETKNDQVLVDPVVNIMMKAVKKMGIRDGQCGSALAILKPRNVLPSLKVIEIDISSDGRCNPELNALLVEVSDRDCEVSLHLHHHWRNLKDGSHLLKHVLTKDRRCRVVDLLTHLEDPSLVPPETKIIWFGLSTNNKEILEAIQDHPSRDRIRLHLSVTQHPQALSPLPTGFPSPYLFLSDVSDGEVEKALETAKALQPVNGEYWRILLPRSSLTTSGAKRLISQMGQEGIRLWGGPLGGGLSVCSPSITYKEKKELEKFSRQLLNCRFDLRDDERIWWL